MDLIKLERGMPERLRVLQTKAMNMYTNLTHKKLKRNLNRKLNRKLNRTKVTGRVIVINHIENKAYSYEIKNKALVINNKKYKIKMIKMEGEMKLREMQIKEENL